jgi:hypothetical protein
VDQVLVDQPTLGRVRRHEDDKPLAGARDEDGEQVGILDETPCCAAVVRPDTTTWGLERKCSSRTTTGAAPPATSKMLLRRTSKSAASVGDASSP